MSSHPFKSNNHFSSSAVRGMSLSLGVALLLSSTGAAIAGDTPGRSNVRIPDEPQQTETQTPSEGDRASGSRFTCQIVNGEYTVMYHPQSQSGKSYPWATPSSMGGGWTPEARCNAITARLESYRPDGLKELRTSVENNYNVICVTTEKNAGCRIVLTVPPGQDPEITRNRVFENLTVADSGQQTDAVNAIVDGGQGGGVMRKIEDALGGISLPGSGSSSAVSPGSIDLRPFLDPADGGTGARLLGGMSSPSNSQLNPGNFR